MNMSRQPRSPTKLNNRSKAITYTDDNGTTSLDTLNLPKKTMLQLSTKEKKPAWDSSSRPITKDSVRSTPKSRPQTKDSVRSNNSLANKRCSLNSLSLEMLKTWLKDAKAQLKKTETERYEK